MYKITFTNSAQKALFSLPKTEAIKIRNRIAQLETDPFPPGYKKLHGQENQYRLRQGNYRILYEVYKNELIVYIFVIDHRKQVYR